MSPLCPWKAAITSGSAARAIHAQTLVLNGMKLCSDDHEAQPVSIKTTPVVAAMAPAATEGEDAQAPK